MVQTSVPDNYRIPGTFFEISPRNPRPSQSVHKILLVGGFNTTGASPTVTGSATSKQPILVTSAAEADMLFGVNSVLAHQFRVARTNAPFSEIWVYPIDVGSSAVAASVQPSITVTGSANYTGTLVIQINGVNYNIPISVDNTSDNAADANSIGTAITNYFSGVTNLPVAVSNSGRDITFTARNTGVIGNQFSLAITDDGIAGLSIGGVANFTGGTGTPFASDWDDGLNDQSFDTIVMPSYFDDVATGSGVAGINTISLRVDGRWEATGPEYGLFGHIWTAIKGESSAIVTTITARNEPHESVVGLEASNPTPEYVAATAYACVAHRSLSSHPARPFTGLQVATVYPVVLNSARFNRAARNSLLNAGVSTIQYVNEQSVIERAVTTDTSAGDTWRQAQIPYTLMVVLRRYRQWIEVNYRRALLVDDLPKDTAGGAFGIQAGSNVVTPKTVKGDFIGLYRDLALELLVEDVDSFKANLIVERPLNDQNRLTSNLPLNLANGLIQFPILVDFTA